MIHVFRVLARFSRRGSILILVTWLVSLFTIFGAALGFAVRQNIRAVQTLERRDHLRDIAEAGVEKSIFVITQRLKNSPVSLNERWNHNPGAFGKVPMGLGYYSVVYQGEQRFPNTKRGEELLRLGFVDEERKLGLSNVGEQGLYLKRLVEYSSGLSAIDAKAIAHSILDWRDEDDSSYALGAEKKYYRQLDPPYLPKNKPLDLLEELMFVKGMTAEIYNRIQPYITIYGEGRINLNTAPPVVLRAIGFEESIVRRLLTHRRGADGLDGTMDDFEYKSPDQLKTVLSLTALSEQERDNLNAVLSSNALTVYSRNFMIRSVSRLNNDKETLMIKCVVDDEGSIVSWREYFS